MRGVGALTWTETTSSIKVIPDARLSKFIKRKEANSFIEFASFLIFLIYIVTVNPARLPIISA